MPVTVTITSPSQGATVGTSFTVTGIVQGATGPFPTPPPLKVRLDIDDAKFFGTVTLNDAGEWSAVFSGVPTGTGGVITATWQPTGAQDSVTNITVQ
jgi:hypothetical protein